MSERMSGAHTSDRRPYNSRLQPLRLRLHLSVERQMGRNETQNGLVGLGKLMAVATAQARLAGELSYGPCQYWQEQACDSAVDATLHYS